METIQLYIPNTKRSMETQKPIAKLVFELNYKGLKTFKTEIENDEVLIQLERFDELQKWLMKWQLQDNPASQNIWNFITDYISIEIILTKNFTTAHPFYPIMRFHLSYANDFYTIFSKASASPFQN